MRLHIHTHMKEGIGNENSRLPQWKLLFCLKERSMLKHVSSALKYLRETYKSLLTKDALPLTHSFLSKLTASALFCIFSTLQTTCIVARTLQHILEMSMKRQNSSLRIPFQGNLNVKYSSRYVVWIYYFKYIASGRKSYVCVKYVLRKHSTSSYVTTFLTFKFKHDVKHIPESIIALNSMEENSDYLGEETYNFKPFRLYRYNVKKKSPLLLVTHDFNTHCCWDTGMRTLEHTKERETNLNFW